MSFLMRSFTSRRRSAAGSDSRNNLHSAVHCEESSSSKGFSVAGAFMELGKSVPLSPSHDSAHHMNQHRWGHEKVPDAQLLGQKQYGEIFDNRNHCTPIAPYPTDARGFHPMPPSEDRINLSYENMLGDEMSLAPKQAGKMDGWRRSVAHSFALYRPKSFAEAKTADDIRIAVNEFSDKVQQDDPDSACKYLLMEEFRCLQTYQVEKDPGSAGRRCVKWFDEYSKCEWDQHKFNQGYAAVEGPGLATKRRPYMFYPDFKYA